MDVNAPQKPLLVSVHANARERVRPRVAPISARIQQVSRAVFGYFGALILLWVGSALIGGCRDAAPPGPDGVASPQSNKGSAEPAPAPEQANGESAGAGQDHKNGQPAHSAHAAATPKEAAPGQGGMPKVLLWHPYTGKERQGLEAALKAYNDKARIPVVAHAVPAALIGTKLARVVPKGQGPDLVVQAHTSMQTWRAAELITPVSNQPAGDADPTYVRGASDAFTAGGRRFGFPLTAKPVVMMCNAAMASEGAEETVEALLAAPTSGSQSNLVYAYADPYMHAAWVQAFGGTIVRDGLPVVTGSAHLAALKYVRKHFAVDGGKAGAIPDDSAVVAAFNRGRARCIFAGTWSASQLSDKLTLLIRPLPKVDGKPLKPLVQYEGVMLTRSSKQPSAAIAAARFLAGPKGAKIRLEVSGQPSAHAETARADTSALGQASIAQLAHSIPLPVIGGAAGRHPFWSQTAETLAGVLGGKVPATEETLANLQRRIVGARAKDKP